MSRRRNGASVSQERTEAGCNWLSTAVSIRHQPAVYVDYSFTSTTSCIPVGVRLYTAVLGSGPWGCMLDIFALYVLVVRHTTRALFRNARYDLPTRTY